MSHHLFAVLFSSEMGDLLIMGTGLLLAAILLRALLPAVGLASRSASKGSAQVEEI